VHAQIGPLAKAPELFDKFEDIFLDMKLEYSSANIANSSRLFPSSLTNDMLVEIQECEWLLTQLGKRL
jgi:hypothetical protein